MHRESIPTAAQNQLTDLVDCCNKNRVGIEKKYDYWTITYLQYAERSWKWLLVKSTTTGTVEMIRQSARWLAKSVIKSSLVEGRKSIDIVDSETVN